VELLLSLLWELLLEVLAVHWLVLSEEPLLVQRWQQDMALLDGLLVGSSAIEAIHSFVKWLIN
jgi:hypothetical protein